VIQRTAFHVPLRQLNAALLDFIFPSICANCRRLGALLCADCEARLPRVIEPLCTRCGRTIPHETQPTQLCPNCQHQPLPLRAIRASFRYADPLDQVVHQMKYEGYFALAEPLARFMVAGRPAWLDTIDLVVPVPLHPKRQRQRGFNQSALLSRYLCRSLNLVLSENALRRIRHTTPQIELGPEERASNVRGAFAAVPRQVAGRHILLVDDVFTTGATLSAAAEALLAAGARVVSGYCLASVG
jgi:ComF family protein